MIVRISMEGQYELDDSDADALNELDNEAVGACEMADEQKTKRPCAIIPCSNAL